MHGRISHACHVAAASACSCHTLCRCRLWFAPAQYSTVLWEFFLHSTADSICSSGWPREKTRNTQGRNHKMTLNDACNLDSLVMNLQSTGVECLGGCIRQGQSGDLTEASCWPHGTGPQRLWPGHARYPAHAVTLSHCNTAHGMQRRSVATRTAASARLNARRLYLRSWW